MLTFLRVKSCRVAPLQFFQFNQPLHGAPHATAEAPLGDVNNTSSSKLSTPSRRESFPCCNNSSRNRAKE